MTTHTHLTTDELKQKSVGDIVADDYRTASVFKAHNIDFCCGGGRSLEEACIKKDINPEELINELSGLDNTSAESHNYKNWSMSFLVDYIINNHHQYVTDKLPELEQYMTKVHKVHGKSYDFLGELAKKFDMIKDEMTMHMKKEEQVLFPYVKQLESALENNSQIEDPRFETASGPIAALTAEHDEAGSLMKDMANLTNNFTPPEGACTTFRVLYQNLSAFQDDLHKHVHLENNILFPKIKEAEKQLD